MEQKWVQLGAEKVVRMEGKLVVGTNSRTLAVLNLALGLSYVLLRS